MKQIVVVGTSGAGKSTFGEWLADRLDLVFVEPDALYWNDDWVGASDDEFRARVTATLDDAAADGWVFAGNYSAVRDVVWQRAQVIIWLDYPLALILWRVTHRSLRRAITREPMWGTNNVETLGRMLSTDSVIWWAASTYHRRRRTYHALMTNSPMEYRHLRWVRFRRPLAAMRWLERL